MLWQKWKISEPPYIVVTLKLAKISSLLWEVCEDLGV